MVCDSFFVHNFFTVGASSVMVARGALWNASIFHPVGSPIEVVKRDYVRKVYEILSILNGYILIYLFVSGKYDIMQVFRVYMKWCLIIKSFNYSRLTFLFGFRAFYGIMISKAPSTH